MPSDKLSAALALAARGLRVFPLKPNAKDPPLVTSVSEATTDAAIITRWWRQWPNANIAVSTDNLLVLDVDPAKGGAESLKFLVAVNDDLPPSMVTSTGRGGAHLYYAVDLPVASSVSKLGKGLDVRGWRGYVVAPGSAIPEGSYALASDAPIAKAPQWLVDLAGAPAERKPVARAIEELDSDHAMKRATDWLRTAAPLAVQGDSGDATTYQVAARLMDFGLSPDGAYEAMQENWNERCSPPWSPEELERKIGNAAKYRQEPIGSRDPRADFEPVEPAAGDTQGADQPKQQSTLYPQPAFDFELGAPKKRDWIVPGLVIRGKVSEVIAPPGAGKSTFTLALAAAIASGKPLTGHPIPRRGRAWLYNNEDDRNELRLRLSALILHHGLNKQDHLAADRLYMNSGEHRPLTIAKRSGQGDTQALRPSQDVAQMIAAIKELQIDALVVDPFAETHEGAENDNIETLAVARLYRRIAQEGNCGVVLVHHTRKLPAGSSEGHVGNMDSGRGASALTGVARVVVTLYGMSEKDAKKHGVALDNRGQYVRLDDAKANLSLGSGKARWYLRRSVDVPAAPVADGDSSIEAVGVLEPVTLSSVEAERGGDETALLLDAAAAARQDARGRPLRSIAEELTRLPLHEGMSVDAVRKRIERAFGDSGSIQVEGETLRLVRKETTNGRGHVVIVADCREGETAAEMAPELVSDELDILDK